MTLDLTTYAQGAIAAIVLSAAVRALPDPEPKGNKAYLFLFNFAHALLANFDKLAASKARSAEKPQ